MTTSLDRRIISLYDRSPRIIQDISCAPQGARVRRIAPLALRTEADRQGGCSVGLLQREGGRDRRTGRGERRGEDDSRQDAQRDHPSYFRRGARDGLYSRERDNHLRRRIALIVGQKAPLWWDLPAADCFILLKESRAVNWAN